MKRSPLERRTPLRQKTELKRTGPLRRTTGKSSTLRRGRGFAASPAQRAKVRGRACVSCGAMQTEYLAIDPAHLCAKGMGGCDEPECVVPLCRSAEGPGCHRAFDRGEFDLLPSLEPAYREEVAHCVTHLGLEGARIRLAPSQYRNDRRAA